MDIRILEYPDRDQLKEALRRPSVDVTRLFGTVQEVIDAVCKEGDAALKRLEEQFDRVSLDSLCVSEEEMEAATQKVDAALQNAIRLAYDNISRFHAAQHFDPIRVETAPGVICEQVAVPIEKVGLYIPGGSAPLFSTVLM